ncbi:MAG: hypothetical protein K0S07_615 [Chlamydiales bacterium]|nr:hypothetical protein [Chlamydiales bacterium]
MANIGAKKLKNRIDSLLQNIDDLTLQIQIFAVPHFNLQRALQLLDDLLHMPFRRDVGPDMADFALPID